MKRNPISNRISADDEARNTVITSEFVTNNGGVSKVVTTKLQPITFNKETYTVVLTAVPFFGHDVYFSWSIEMVPGLNPDVVNMTIEAYPPHLLSVSLGGAISRTIGITNYIRMLLDMSER